MKDRRVFLAAVLESIDLIRLYVDGYDKEEFLMDRKTQDAVVRNLEIIGQALKDFGVDSLANSYMGVPWREIAGMRNVLAHEYLGVDMIMVWNTVQTHLEPLRRAIEEVLSGNGSTAV